MPTAFSDVFESEHGLGGQNKAKCGPGLNQESRQHQKPFQPADPQPGQGQSGVVLAVAILRGSRVERIKEMAVQPAAAENSNQVGGKNETGLDLVLKPMGRHHLSKIRVAGKPQCNEQQNQQVEALIEQKAGERITRAPAHLDPVGGNVCADDLGKRNSDPAIQQRQRAEQ